MLLIYEITTAQVAIYLVTSKNKIFLKSKFFLKIVTGNGFDLHVEKVGNGDEINHRNAP